MQVGSIILSHLYSKALACCCKNTIVKVPPPITIATTAARDNSIIIVIIICVRLQRHYHYIRYIGLGNYDCFFFTKLFLNYLLLLLLFILLSFTPIVNSVSAPPHLPHTAPPSTNTPGSGELLYLGISSKSANKGDNTKSAASHHSSNDDNSFDTTTKIKTPHTSSGSSSDKPNKQTSTISNNIAESHHNTKPSSSSKSTSHSNDNSNDGGGATDSGFGHSDPLSDALDAMSNILDHLFGYPDMT
jgi:hypothetical protein